ncbi:hypothetical protein JI435_421360 [Parastagonospora nodorum SN15]|uniref:Uncharacterized protein n=1 Tax=Phaeosphaeria nodorum (strain SN15 / ATCC MYA-4574 / FGSC 10173) TaxID=321614 RepID=A0A7U2I5U4_PHANO|nr:hypothetical protein JI435_421360 [Parastagonospora nodorum SN15]
MRRRKRALQHVQVHRLVFVLDTRCREAEVDEVHISLQAPFILVVGSRRRCQH